MRLTNSLNLPSPLVTAVRHDDYNKGECDFSVTELIGPPRIAQLRRRHFDEIEEDASDRIFALLGKSIHTILEDSAGDIYLDKNTVITRRYIVEMRYYMKCAGVRIGGQIDLYDRENASLEDWKITSYHSVSNGPKPEWVAQLNINKLILEANDIPVKSLKITAIFRDWSKMMAARRADYPERQVQVIEIPIWPKKQAEQFLEERIRVHLEARKGELPLCTPEERWEDPTRWALMKKGLKRAVKLYDTEETAIAAADKADYVPTRTYANRHYVEERPGEAKRCLFYCQVAKYCDYGRELLREKDKI